MLEYLLLLLCASYYRRKFYIFPANKQLKMEINLKRIEKAFEPELYKTLIESYEMTLTINARLMEEVNDTLKSFELPVLTPTRIKLFTQAASQYSEHRNYPLITGLFATRLIENSYNAGKGVFDIKPFSGKRIAGLGYRLKGQKDKPLEIRVEGNAGSFCCYGAENIRIEAKRAGDFFAHSSGNVSGNITFTGDYAGWFCKCLRLTTEVVGKSTGTYASDSVFRTHTRFTLEELFESIGKRKDNRVVHILDWKGKKERMVFEI